MKKIINVLIAVLMIACLAVTFTACNKPCAENEHDWQTLEVTKEATCKEEGSEKVKCAKCGEETTRSIPKAEHKASDIVDIPAVDADCGNAGSHGGRKCNLCGTVTVQPTVDPATGNHNYEGQTYLQDGDKHYQKCKVCGADGPKADHVYDQTGDKCVCGKLDPAVIATIGSVNYKSLSEAVAAGGEITLIKDAAISAKITVTKAVTINLNGHNITLAAQAGTTHINMFAVAEGGALTIKGSGNVRNENANGYVISAYNNGQVIIESGNYYATDCTVVQLDNTAKATIKGGTFAVKGEDEYGTRYVLNKIDSARDSAVFEVMGGSFTNFDPSNSPSEDPAQSFLADGYAAVEKDGVYTVSKIDTRWNTSFNTTAYDAIVLDQKCYLIGIIDRYAPDKNNSTANAEKYGNVYIKNKNGDEFYIYGIKSHDGTKKYEELGTNKSVVGDVVVLYGKIIKFGSTIEMENGWLVQLNGDALTTKSAIVLADLNMPESADSNFELPQIDGLTWSASGTGITISGNTAQIVQGDADRTVTLTATVEIDQVRATKDFTIVIPKAGAKSLTIDFKPKNVITNAEKTSGTSTLTIGATQLAVSYTNCKNTSEYMMMYSKGAGAPAYFANTTAIPGKIKKITFKAPKGSSGSAVYNITVGATKDDVNKAIVVSTESTNSKIVKATTDTNANGSTFVVEFDGTCSFFNITTTTKANGQIAEIIIDYEPNEA